jgi:hypothetical protein
MKALLKIICWLFFIQLLAGTTFSQTGKPKLKGWHLLSYNQDGYMGTGVTEAYKLLKGRKSTTVIVAVIDSGVDTLQEDLKTVLWVNPKEIPGNGKDDDGNGYTDDIHGWNFCGSSSGENLNTNTHEIERVYHHWKSEFEGKKEKDITANRLFLFKQWQRAEELIDKDYKEYQKNITNVENAVNVLQTTSRIISSYLGQKEFIRNEIALINSADSLGWAVKVWNNIFSKITGAH